MCNQGCPYESHTGACKGRKAFATKRAQPYCMDKEDFEAFVESHDDDRILAYDLDREESAHAYA